MAAWIKVVCFQNTQNALCEKYTGGDFISISKLFFRIISIDEIYFNQQVIHKNSVINRV